MSSAFTQNYTQYEQNPLRIVLIVLNMIMVKRIASLKSSQ